MSGGKVINYLLKPLTEENLHKLNKTLKDFNPPSSQQKTE